MSSSSTKLSAEGSGVFAAAAEAGTTATVTTTTAPQRAEGDIKIHSADAFIEVIKNAHPVLPLRQKRVPLTREERDQQAAKDNIANKQKVREIEFLKGMETAKLEQQRRVQEKQLAKDREFQERLQSLLLLRDGFVKDMATLVREEDQYKQRTKEELHSEWVKHVYHPLTQKINEHINSLDMAEIGNQKRQAMKAYLDLNTKKKGQVFGDIILEAEYDPLQFRSQNHVTYKSEITHDPCKPKSMRRKNQEKEFAVTALPAVYPKAKVKEMFPVTMWAKVDATPFGRYAIDTRPHGLGKPPASDKPVVGVMADDYSYLPMAEVKKIQEFERQELGKRIVGPVKPCAEEALRGRRPPRSIAKMLGSPPGGLIPGQSTLLTLAGDTIDACSLKKKLEGKKYIAVKASKEAPLLGKRTYSSPKKPQSPYATVADLPPDRSFQGSRGRYAREVPVVGKIGAPAPAAATANATVTTTTE